MGIIKTKTIGETPFPLITKGLLLVLYLVPCVAFPWLILDGHDGILENSLLRVAVFSLFVMLGIAVFRIAIFDSAWMEAILFTTLFYAAVYKIAAYFPEVSNYPLSMGWSESSRFYYASLFFSQRIYGAPAPLPVLHPSRYLLQAIPFLIPAAPIWLHRLWQIILWVTTSLAAAHFLARRLSIPDLHIRWGMVLMSFLFLLVAPVYYHLLVMIILVLWGFDRNRPLRTLIVVLVASAWAGISRINWVPVPGLLAAALYLLEQEIGKQPWWKYLLKPAGWFVTGSLVGYLVTQVYQTLSGNPGWEFGSSFTSDLLWYRLFPNVTYPMGILLSAILFSLPLVLILLLRLYKEWGNIHPTRLLGLAAILAILFAGGIVVSVKIGGGSNLHNLDAFLSLLLVVGAYAAFKRYRRDFENPRRRFMPTYPLLGLAVIVTVFFTILMDTETGSYNTAQAQAAIQTIQINAQQTAQAGKEVLFIRERQLMTFGQIQGIRLVPDYEEVFLQEMAMANNQRYLDQFTTDIKNRRFGLIVSDVLTVQYQGRLHGFGEENDAWVSRVSEPVLCYYEPVLVMSEIGIELLAPRSQPCN
jgi:hypothetical protein